MSLPKQAIDSYKQREEMFWRGISQHDKSEYLSHGLDPTSLLFYGELTMAALGLKPCVLFSYLGEKITPMYMAQVLGKGEPWVDYGLRFGIIDQDIGSPDLPLSGTLYAMATRHNLSGEVLDWLTGKRGSEISDETLALLLDYPVPLPPLDDRGVIEVAYVDMQANGAPMVVMTYCASQSQSNLVNSHFKRYRQALIGLMDLRISVSAVG